MNRRCLGLRLTTVLMLLCVPALSFARQATDRGLDATGLQQNRAYFSDLPFENIDTLSGSVVLTFTDLVLPGNAGRELRFLRTYNSKSRKWTFGVSGVALQITNPAYPTTPPNPEPQERTPNLLMGDGSVKRTAWHVSPSVGDTNTLHVTVSQDFWLLNRGVTPPTLTIPNGDTCKYETDPAPNMLRVTECVDPFGNLVTFSWLPAVLNEDPVPDEPAKLVITQEFEGPDRVITLKFGDLPDFPSSMEFGNATWEYTFSGNDLITAEGPEERTWTYGYNSELVSLETPDGGIIEYTYDNANYPVPNDPNPYTTRVLTVRETDDGRGIVTGRWDYAYNISENGQGGLSTETTVETGTTRTIYKHEAEQQHAFVFDGEGGALPLKSREVKWNDGSDWITLELEEREYQIVPVLSYFNFGTLQLTTRTVTRDDGGEPFITELEYSETDFGDYHNPKTITEKGTVGGGSVERVTARTYEHLTASVYAVGLPKDEEVTVSGITYEKEWAYDPLTGFKTEETIHGITTSFARTDKGNVRRVTRENNKSTLFEYEYGQVSKIVTPAHITTRTINPEGTIASQTITGRTTTYDYDDLGRVTSIVPPGANATQIDYEADGGEWVWTTRGAGVNKVRLDGFGRPIHTIDPAGVEVKTRYDAEGRVVREGYPFRPTDTTGNVDIWTAIAYDALGRVRTRTHPDTSTVAYAYGVDGEVTIEETVDSPTIETRSTVQTWEAFGNPSEARLTKVIDPAGQAWNYTYHALGGLAGVSSTDALRGTITRSWTYYATTGLLETETHPESGQTSYVYDSVGLLASKTDANGVQTKYTYDNNDRVKTITAGTRETLISYEPGSDNRAAALNPFAGIVWRYDPGTGRLLSRQDRIGEKAFTTYFEYNDNDQVTKVTHPAGRKIQYEYAYVGGPLTRIFESEVNRNYAHSIAFHASGGVKSYTAGNGTTTVVEYDPARYWTESIVSGPLDLEYQEYDRVGNPHSIVDPRSGFSQTFSYDVLDRLTSATGWWGGPTEYGYDAHGNRVAGTNYQYGSGTLRLSSDYGVGFVYDNVGNPTTIGTNTFTYTPQNQVETAAVPGILETYAYDADDQRVKKTDGTTTTYYIRGAGGQLLTEWKDPGTVNGRIRDYIYIGSNLVSAVARDSSEDPAGDPTVSSVSHRYATGWQVGGGGGGTVNLTKGAMAAARRTSHPDMPPTGLRLGFQNGGTVDILTAGPILPSAAEAPRQSGVFLEFKVDRLPFSNDAEFLGIDGGGWGSSITDALRLYITPAGALVLKNDGGRPVPVTVWTSSAIDINVPHTLELRFGFNTNFTQPPPNPAYDLNSWVSVKLDGVSAGGYGNPGGWTSLESNPVGLDQTGNGGGVFNQVNLKSPGPANGLLMNVFRSGLTAEPTGSGTLDDYGSGWRTTLLQAAGPGTYAEWTGGLPDWRGRSMVAGESGSPVTTTTSLGAKKISYRMESMLARGITGRIANVLVGVRMFRVTPNTRVFIRRNGVETILTDFILAEQINRWYRVSNAGWSPTDVVEVGVLSGDAGQNHLNSVALVVEHDTPEPEPLTDTAARVMTFTYTGSGGAQTFDFGIDQMPTVLMVMPVSNVPSPASPTWWWDSRLGAAPMVQSVPNFGRLWPQQGRFHVIDAAPHSPNANGTDYIAIAIFDPSNRYVLPFAVAKPSEDDFTHTLRYPQTGETAADFAPDFVFGGASFGTTNSQVNASLYKGPGHVGDSTGTLGLAQAATADRVQSLGTGTVQFGTAINASNWGEHAFWAGRVVDGVDETRLMAVTSYTGNGASSRDITVDLNGETPVLAFVVPTNANARVYRVTGGTTGRNVEHGGAVANSITAMAADKITVGSALNANGVTYDVWTITTGFVAPK